MRRIPSTYFIAAGALLLLVACHSNDNDDPPQNQPPQVEAGANQSVTLFEEATLSGVVTDDRLPSNPGTLAIEWSAISGPGAVTFANANAAATTVSFSEAGDYVLRLSADDGELQASDELTVSAALPAIATTAVYTALPAFTNPIALVQAPGDGTQWFVAEQGGAVYSFANDAAVDRRNLLVDISDRVICCGERGLLGIAFHPDFAINAQVFLSYTTMDPGVLTSRISRFASRDSGQTLDAGSEQIILEVVQPFTNHNGGNILFGPDGYLYIGFGDGGSGNDPENNAQDTTNWLGAMLRIDVDGGNPYAIPSGPDGNTFAGNARCVRGVGVEPCPEIYAWGLRNPFRWSFDRQTGRLWLGDVGEGGGGQLSREEIDIIEKGNNYGWRLFEGTFCNTNINAPNPCSSLGLIFPVTEYEVPGPRAVTGGYVYRGSAMPGQQGVYFYADFGQGLLFRYRDDGNGNVLEDSQDSGGLSIPSFGEDIDGELYVLDYFSGTIHQIVETAAP